MKIELFRSELQRLLRQAPFEPFIMTFKGGERALIQHPENVAFDPTPGSRADLYVLTGGLRLYSTFEDVTGISILSGPGTIPGQPASTQP